MDIYQFVEVLHQEVEDFKKYWIEQEDEDPDNFPSDLELPGWFEQIDSYNSIMMKRDSDEDYEGDYKYPYE